MEDANTGSIMEYKSENIPKRSGDSVTFYTKDLGSVMLNEDEYDLEYTSASHLVIVTKKNK